MENVAKGIIAALFLAMTGAFAFFLINFRMNEDSGYGTAILTAAIFLLVILGIIGISYFANRGN